MLDSGAPFYDVYETKDGHWVAVGAIEEAFYRQLLQARFLAIFQMEYLSSEVYGVRSSKTSIS